MTDKLMSNKKTWTDFVKFTQQMHDSFFQEEEDNDDSEYKKESYEYYNLNCKYNLL